MQIKELAEEWRDIKENVTSAYGVTYQVSNLGRVRSLDRIKYDSRGRKRVFSGKILKPLPQNNGYMTVWLTIRYRRRKMTIHRLVAKTFLENKRNYPIINHIDGNKNNNHIDNLEWCTYKHNSDHALNNGLKPKCKLNVEEVKELYKTMTTKEIGSKLQCDPSYISIFMKKNNIETRNSGQRGYDREYFMSCLKKGMKNAEIAKIFNIDRTTVYRRKAALGV